jgi:VCBS repeat-containing protein
MRTMLRSKVTLLFLACAFAIFAVAGTTMALTTDGSGTTSLSPTIQSDKADYAPGELVTLTGSNWQPGESVNVVVNDDEGQSWNRNVNVTADASGNISDSFNLPDWFVATYKVTATGAQSGVATSSFTDGNVKVTSGSNSYTFVLNWTQHNGTNSAPSNTCNSTNTTTGSEPAVGNSGGAVFQKGVDRNSSIVLNAADTASNGFVFTGWKGETASDTFLAQTDPHAICVTGDFTGSRSYFPQYELSEAPTLTRNNASVTVNEGQTAANTGTWSDANELDTVTLSASVGTVTKNADGTWSWSYATTDGPPQSQTVTITATDNHGKSSTTTFALTVNNVAPTAVNDNPAAVAEGGTVTLNVLANDTDPAGSNDPLTVTNNTNGQHGTVNCAPTGSCTYTPNDPDFYGTDSFTYTVGDGDGGTSVGTVNVTVTPVDDNPVAVNDNKTVAEDDPATTINVLANDTDVDGGPKTIASATQPANGTVVVAANGRARNNNPQGD